MVLKSELGIVILFLKKKDSKNIYGYISGSCKRAEFASNHMINLPTHNRLSYKDLKKICNLLKKYAFYKSLQKGILQQDKVKGAMAVLVSQEDRAKAIKIARDMWTQDLDDNTSIINFKNTRL